MKKILVVDDKRANLELAKTQLGSACELTLAPTFSSAKQQLLSEKSFDAVFTDVMLLGEQKGIRKDHPDVGAEIPYGLIIAILAKNKGIEKVMLVTDLNHHSGAIAWAIGTLKTNEGHITCIGTKNWEMAYRDCFGAPPMGEQQGPAMAKDLDWLIISNDYIQEKGLDQWMGVLPEGEEKMFININEPAKLLHNFVMRNPKRTLLIGELSVEENDYDVKEEFELLKRLKLPGQKIVVAGWLDIKDEECYLRLPFTSEELLKKFDELE